MRKAGLSFRPKKRFGQNFLKDTSVIQELVKCIQPTMEDELVEIGPGLGAMTFALLPYVNDLNVIELDRDLAALLREKKEKKLIIHEHDALQFNFKELIKENKKIRVVGNLPYNISAPLLFHVLSFAENVVDMNFMLQKEVVDRLVASPGTKAYGRLSVMVQYRCQTEALLLISPKAFYPEPKVESAFVRLLPYETLPYVAHDIEFFSKVVRHAFGQRRKTLKNNLHGIVPMDVFEKLNIDSRLRAEQLSVEDFVRLSNG